MALGEKGWLFISILSVGILSFIFGVIAENKKPAGGTPIKGKGVVICKYPSDPTIFLGSLSIICLFLTAIVGVVSVFYPYNRRAVSAYFLQKNTTLVIFFCIALVVSVFAEGLLLWALITEALHRKNNIHYDLNTDCPTAKTGLFGGAAFLALDSALFWLICQMLTLNTREDYDDDEDLKEGHYGQVLAEDYTPSGNVRTDSTV
eukprot:TRINITY_DN968_c0_g1_i1.p1 TRINITY_DN968_c0_g1~~TRINITY_DN968_c0_g1_i1.p1  ORF type:complete len:204 (+),score=25.10 TRINITY_DN968_c0_g1_i1:349-960(+)